METINKQTPRIALTIIEKTGKKYYLRPSIRKTRKMIRTGLKSKFKNGVIARLRVVYGKAETSRGNVELFDNRADVSTLEELNNVFTAFIDKDLWLPKPTGD